jgi:two-component system chemotaxis response regulator CheB
VEALSEVVSGFPADVDAAVLVVLHLPLGSHSVLPAILSRAGRLPARHAEDGEPLEAARIFVAPPGYHMMVDGAKVGLRTGPRENGHRPSVDVLFRSVAEQCRAAGAGVVLSGFLDDGAAGLAAIKHYGGYTVVQTPADATFPAMPSAAIRTTLPHAVCPAAQVFDCLQDWLEGVGGLTDDETFGEESGAASETMDPELTELTCPECGGTLWKENRFDTCTFRCRVGHAFSSESLLSGKHDALEAAIWAAIVALEERRDLSRRVLERLKARGESWTSVERYEREVEESDGRAAMLRQLFEDLVRNHPAEERHDGDGGR